MTGRLREFAEHARDLGYLIVLSAAPPGLPIACKEVARHGLAGIPEDWMGDLDLFEAMLPLLRWLIWPEDKA